MWPKMKTVGRASISGLLPGLVALSCLSAGWLLGYGLSPSTTASMTSPWGKGGNGRFLTTVPAYRQDYRRSSDRRMILNGDFEK